MLAWVLFVSAGPDAPPQLCSELHMDATVHHCTQTGLMSETPGLQNGIKGKALDVFSLTSQCAQMLQNQRCQQQIDCTDVTIVAILLQAQQHCRHGEQPDGPGCPYLWLMQPAKTPQSPCLCCRHSIIADVDGSLMAQSAQMPLADEAGKFSDKILTCPADRSLQR